MTGKNGSKDYVTRVHEDPADLDAGAWDALVDARARGNPFMKHACLLALHRSGSAVAGTGWQPQFLTLWRGDTLAAACPLYLKSHSWGEYVFDWAWADAYERHGLAYYPKLLCAVPFTPVPGPRLLAHGAADRVALLEALAQATRDSGLSSAHVLFLDEEDQQAARAAGWLMRSTVQFHWENRSPQPYADFADFLSALQRERRKKIQQERRRVAEAGVRFRVLQGPEISRADWDYFHACYVRTYRQHRSRPYLTRAFFDEVATTLPDNWLLFIAERDGQPVATSLLGIDPVRRTAFGRYWGSTESIPCLHFEACYYQPLQWCIAQGYQRFEGGAQGEHKMWRGLMPQQAWSAHWLAHPAFADAVARYLEREGAGIADYVSELNEHTPFRTAG
jgi:predicted N-acyltransferase